MARKTIRVSDQSGEEIPDGKGALVRITFADARKGVRELDLTDAEAETLRLGGAARAPLAGRRDARRWACRPARSQATDARRGPGRTQDGEGPAARSSD
jgi:hypothetical protein